MEKIIVGYLIIINIIGLFIMAVDKKRAIKQQWRIPEKTLFMCSLLGGSIGTWVGMYAFHHKTKHWYFVIGMPAILIVQIVLVAYFFKCY